MIVLYHSAPRRVTYYILCYVKQYNYGYSTKHFQKCINSESSTEQSTGTKDLILNLQYQYSDKITRVNLEAAYEKLMRGM